MRQILGILSSPPVSSLKWMRSGAHRGELQESTFWSAEGTDRRGGGPLPGAGRRQGLGVRQEARRRRDVRAVPVAVPGRVWGGGWGPGPELSCIIFATSVMAGGIRQDDSEPVWVRSSPEKSRALSRQEPFSHMMQITAISGKRFWKSGSSFCCILE